jgi:hypothetical protein
MQKIIKKKKIKKLPDYYFIKQNMKVALARGGSSHPLQPAKGWPNHPDGGGRPPPNFSSSSSSFFHFSLKKKTVV